VNHRFLAGTHPPSSHDGPALVVHVGAGTVAIVDDEPDGSAHFVGVLDGRAVWAVDVVDAEPADGVPLMGLWGAVDEVVWTVAGRAVQLVEWDRTHRYCGRCAAATEPAPLQEGRARRCPACGLLAFPRLAPAMIVLVTRDGGREALLARGTKFPVPMWSCLAGFVEPGETLEEAVHREVFEEVGVTVDDVRYWGSQPWPFPHSLMLGFTASWAGGDLVLDPMEIAEADWYRADDLPPIPPGMSIARRMIDAWLESQRAS
jgi:NAD+ diphosphatase